MGSTSISFNTSKTARTTKLCSLASLLICMSATIPLTMAAATPHQDAQASNFTTEYWQHMNYDQYLRTYPNGNVMSLPQYIKHLALPESFECGVGKHKSCHMPHLEKFVKGPDVHILHAAGIWNWFTDSMVQAYTESVFSAKAVVHQVLKDLTYEYHPLTTKGLLTEVDLIKTLLSPIEHGGNMDTHVSDRTNEPDWLAAIRPIANSVNQLGANLNKRNEATHYTRVKRQLPGTSATPMEVPLIVYNSTKPTESNLDDLSLQLHHMLVQSIENKINSPISLDTGIYSALQGGRFTSPQIEPAKLSSNAMNITALVAISGLLNRQNAMVLIRKSRCSEHREQIKQDVSRLAFCTSDSTLIEIVFVNGEDSFTKHMYNAHMIHDKYGFKTSFLASEAARCQQAIELSGSDNLQDDPNNPYDVCTFQLPICNLEEEYHQTLLKRGENIVHTCRQEFGLPI